MPITSSGARQTIGRWVFNTPQGHFEHLVMLIGLRNFPSVFQVLVKDILWDMLNRFLFVYINYILIIYETLGEHIQHIYSRTNCLWRLRHASFMSPQSSLLVLSSNRGSFLLMQRVTHSVLSKTAPVFLRLCKLLPSFHPELQHSLHEDRKKS